MGRALSVRQNMVEVAQVCDLPSHLPAISELLTKTLNQKEICDADDEQEMLTPTTSSSRLVAKTENGTLVLKHTLTIPSIPYVDDAPSPVMVDECETSSSDSISCLSCVPPALLLAARLHHLCNEYLGTADKLQTPEVDYTSNEVDSTGNASRSSQQLYVEEQVLSLASKAAKAATDNTSSQADTTLPANIELVALLDVLNIVNVRVGLVAEAEEDVEEKLEQHNENQNSEREQEQQREKVERLEGMSLVVERVLSEIHMLIRKQTRRVLRKGVMPARKRPDIGELNLSLRSLEQGRDRVAKLCTLMMPRIEASLATTALSVTYLWLVGLLRHEHAVHCSLVDEAWPLAIISKSKEETMIDVDTEDDGKFWDKVLYDDEGGNNVLLKIFREKMLMWGSWVISQWALLQTVSHLDISQFGRESVTIRNEYSWSIPTKMALDMLAKVGPMIEIGAGKGIWMELLLKRGVDIIAYDTMKWSDEFNDSGLHSNGESLLSTRSPHVKEGGPNNLLNEEEVVVCLDKRTYRSLVLMWPDYMGNGTYGSECLRKFKGDTLVLVGEWQGFTCGSYTAGVPEHGQSFSKNFQNEVEANFTLVAKCRLPTWPLFFDSCMIWKRNQQKEE